MTTTPILGITQLQESQAMPEVVVNEADLILEFFASRIIVKSQGDNSPPGSPADGDAYLIGSAATGAWTGHDEDIALRLNGAWIYRTPREGLEMEVEDEDASFVLRGGTWIDQSSSVSGLDDLSDVDLTGAATGDVLTKDSGGDWVPAAPASVSSSGFYVQRLFATQGAAVTFNVNSTSYVSNNSLIVPIDLTEFPATDFKIHVNGQANGGGPYGYATASNHVWFADKCGPYWRGRLGRRQRIWKLGERLAVPRQRPRRRGLYLGVEGQQFHGRSTDQLHRYHVALLSFAILRTGVVDGRQGRWIQL